MADDLKQTSDVPRAAALTTDGTKPSSNTTVSSFTPRSLVGRGNKTARDGSHGLKFESKLLALFCIRGLGAGYKFELGKENEDLAGKFDDVIFRYEVADETSTGKHWRYQYLQAKHKENENNRKITANDLLDPKGNGPFSLKKYFLSYCKMRVRGDDVRDCIVCTNWGVNEEKFKIIKLEEVKEQHDILKFSPGEKTTRSYKLQIDQVLRKETIKLLEVSDIEALGVINPLFTDKLMVRFWDENATNFNENDEELTLDLDSEKVVDSKSNKFHSNFLNDENLSVSAQKFRQKICEVIDDFYKKLIFVVDMPNEIQFKQIIETEDVKKYYQNDKCKVQTSRIFDEISDAFEKKSANFWLTSEKGKKILLAGVADVSFEYQRQLEKMVGFNENAIKIMEKKLRQLMDSPGNKKVHRIATPSPQLTAVKVVSAVQFLFRDLKQERNYLVAPYTRLQDKEEIHRWKNILKLQKGFYHFFIAVCDNEESVENYIHLISGDKVDDNNFMIIISRDGALDGMTDEIKYTDMSKEFQHKILSRVISFQGENLTVRDLVDDKPEEIIDFDSMKELLFDENKIKIPSYDTPRFEESLYIKRRVKSPVDDHFEDEIAQRLNCTVTKLREQCIISPEGHIEWLVEEKRQKEIWEKMKNDAVRSTLGKTTEDGKLICFEVNEEKKVVISGVAGTGKSTLLSHYYREIKKAKPDHWVFRINLVDRCEALRKLNSDQTDETGFFIHFLYETGNKNSFTDSLLRHRLRTGDKIVIMFDGFDEIDVWCQKSAIQLMKAISKSIQLYVTTRPHSVDDLQNDFFQFSYSLENFDIDHQINYLTDYWETNFQQLDIQDKSVMRKFAGSLTDRVSQSLKDKERSFIGVPLQCRILAECFQSEIQAIIQHNNTKDGVEQTDFDIQMLANVKFDLNSLYKLLMDTKRKVFFDEKANSANQNQIVVHAITRLIKDIESHLTKLAIETLVTDKKNVDILWPPQSSYHQLETEKIQEEKIITEFGVKFGLIIFKESDGEQATKTQFLHRTFAEYLLAKYLFNAIAVNHCEDNQLLDNEPVRDLIVSQILVEENYDGVRVFLDSMLKETVSSNKWRLVIEQEIILPNRLQNFAGSLAHHITALREDDASLPPPKILNFNYMALALMKANLSLFFTLFECLERKFENIEMNSIVRLAFDKRFCFSFEIFFYLSNRKLFRRVISYYDDADSGEVQRIVKEILYNPITTPFSSLESYRFLWEKEETKEIVKAVLQFMEKHQTDLNPIWESESNYFGRLHFSVALLHFFVFNEYYNTLFDHFFRLISSVYVNDCVFIKLLNRTLKMRDSNNNNWAYPSNSGIDKTLINLRNLGRYKVMEGLSHLALVWDKQVFDKFYQPFRPNKDDDCSDVQLLLEKDSSGMTRLHRAAFYGDAETVDNILETIRKNCSFGHHPDINKHLVESSVMDIMLARTCERFTPFYVASASGHKEICLKILSFVTEILGVDHKEDLIDYDGFVYSAMWDAILFENLQMYQLILEVVKEAWGQDSLLVLLKTENSEIDYNKSHFYVSNSYTEKHEKELLKIKVEVLLQNDSEKGYEDLNDLVLASRDRRKIEKTLGDVEDETLQGMLSVKGLVNWTKRFLDINIDWAFDFLSNRLLAKFTSYQRSQFVEVIASPHTPIIQFYREVEMSYWVEWLLDDKFPVKDFDCLDKLLKLIKGQSRTDFQKLLFNNNGKDLTRVLVCGNKKIVSIVSKYVSRTDQLKITKYVRKNGPEIIDEIYQSSFNSSFEQQALHNWVNIIPFYSDSEGKQYFKKIVETLVFLRTEKHRKGKVQYSFWSQYLDSCDKDGNKVEMVDQFLKCVSEKLGKRAVRKIVLHKDCMGIVLLGSEFQENKQLVNVMLTHLNDQDRDCVNLLIIENSPFNSRRQRSGKSCQCKPMNSCAC